jgi:putative transposase
VAVAVNLDGRREVLGIAVQPSEAEVFWDEFLRSSPIAACAAPA